MPCDVVKTYLEKLDWKILLHPPYSPDIAPSEYYLFWLMSHVLAEKRFQSFEDIKKWVDSWIASKDEEFFRNGIRKLPEKWRNVIASNGQYFQYVSSFRFIINALLNNKINSSTQYLVSFLIIIRPDRSRIDLNGCLF